MLDLLKKILGAETDPYALTIKEATELVVEESIHKIRLLGGYQKKLRQPVETALRHCADLAMKIPGILDISGNDKTHIELIRCLFDDEDHARQVVSESPELKEFLTRKNVEEVFFLLTMQRQEKSSFGARLQGEMIVRDVLEKAVLFDDFKVTLPSETIEAAYHSISLALLKVLAHQALENTLALQQRELELEKLRDEVEVKLKIMKHGRQQVVFDSSDSESQNPVFESQNLLDEIETELDQVESKTDQREFYLNQLTEVLIRPDQYLSVDLIPLKINRLGFFVRERSCDAEGAECIAEFKSVDGESRSAVLIKCRRDQLETE